MAVEQFTSFRIDLQGSLDSTVAKRIPDPPGFSSSLAKEKVEKSSSGGAKPQTADVAKRQAALFSMATSPLMQAGTMIMMMWFSGSQLNFFSIMATLNGFYTPFKAIMKAGSIFRPDAEGKLDVITPRLLYSLIQGAVVLFALYKINLLGLLPTRLGDWVGSIQAPDVREHATQSLL